MVRCGIRKNNASTVVAEPCGHGRALEIEVMPTTPPIHKGVADSVFGSESKGLLNVGESTSVFAAEAGIQEKETEPGISPENPPPGIPSFPWGQASVPIPGHLAFCAGPLQPENACPPGSAGFWWDKHLKVSQNYQIETNPAFFAGLTSRTHF